MSKEDYLNLFNDVGHTFLYEVNNERTREEIIRSYSDLIRTTFNDHIGTFIDRTSFEEEDQGIVTIRVIVVNEDEMTIEEFCEYLSKNEKYLKR